MFSIVHHLRNRHSFSLKSQGSSMLPILRPDDVMYYQKTSFRQCKTNDIIMVKKNGNIFTHRIIYIYKRWFKTVPYLITKGDNNLESDGRIYSKQIIAKVVEVKRNSKRFDPENLYLLQSTLYFQAIVKIKKRFERAKIDFVFLKGLPLHLYYEKSHPRRIYLDCDVLVKPEDFSKAQKILFDCGYEKAQTELSASHAKIKDKESENAYYKIINGFSVVFDLHLEAVFMMTQLGKLEALYPQAFIDQLTQNFLETKRKVKINNELFWILDTEYLILYLVLHFFHHNFRGAFRLEFLDKIIVRACRERNDILLDVSRRIKQYQLQNFVYPVFLLLKKYYQTPIPSRFLRSIKLSSSTLNYLGSIFDDEPRISAGITRFKNLFFLSPNPLWRKLFVLINPQVLYSIFWIFQRRVFSFFSNRQ